LVQKQLGVKQKPYKNQHFTTPGAMAALSRGAKAAQPAGLTATQKGCTRAGFALT